MKLIYFSIVLEHGAKMKTSINKNYLFKLLNKKAQESFDWKNWVNSIRADYYNTGAKQFELSARYTHSGVPVVLFYDILPSTRGKK